MSVEENTEENRREHRENKAIVDGWVTEFWGKDFNPAVIDELAAPISVRVLAHPPCRGRTRCASSHQVPRGVSRTQLWGTAI